MKPEDIFGHKFSAVGRLTIPLKTYRAAASTLLDTLNRIEEEGQPTLEQSLSAAGWLLSKGKREVEINAGASGMFSGRWRENDVNYLRELAKAGFSGWVQIEGEEDVAVEYTLADGNLAAEGYVPEHPWDDEEEFEGDDDSPSP